MLSELKTRYLYASMAELRSKNRTRTPAPGPNTTGTAGTTPAAAITGATGKARASGTAGAAEPIIREALVDAQTVALRGPRPAWKGWRVRHLAAIGIAMAGALLVFGMGRTLLWGGDHARFSRDQLDRVSPYLSRGARSENGRGPAFVARIRDGWSALQASKRTLVAADLVETLRKSGVRDVMIYDDDGLLRIQALGEQSPRLLPGLEPERCSETRTRPMRFKPLPLRDFRRILANQRAESTAETPVSPSRGSRAP